MLRVIFIRKNTYKIINKHCLCCLNQIEGNGREEKEPVSGQEEGDCDGSALFSRLRSRSAMRSARADTAAA